MRTHRKIALCALCLVVLLLLGVPLQAGAGGIAVVKSHDIAPLNQALAGFIEGCASQVTEYTLRGSRRGEVELFQRLLATRPRLILAIGALAAQAAKERVREIPVVFIMVPNPQKYGLKGDNIAGISLDIPLRTQFALYRSMSPGLKSIGVLYHPEKTGAMVKEAEAVAERLGLQLLAAPVSSQKAVPAALRGLLGKIDALWMVPDDTVVTPDSFQFLLLTAFENNLPFLAVSEIFVEAGALASLSPDYTDVGRQGCQLATEIDSGRKSPAGSEILSPARVNLAVNLKTAGKIGISLPAEILKTANKVYR